MQALRIEAFQETACYTRPFANKVTETYPLPPYSSVKGFLHAILGAKELIPFTLSIQGEYESMIIDYRTTYFVKKNSVNMPIIFDGLDINTPEFPDMTSMPLYTHMLYNVRLVFHIRAEKDILIKIYDSIKSSTSYFSLGRQEDLLRIDDISFTELFELDTYVGTKLKHSMYIPEKVILKEERGNGIPYNLNWTYEVKNGIREWERIPVVYFPKNKLVDNDLLAEPVFSDDKDYVVIFNE